MAQSDAYKVRPEDKCQDAIPKGQFQETDGKEPRYDPQTARQCVMFYFNFFHMQILYTTYAKQYLCLFCINTSVGI